MSCISSGQDKSDFGVLYRPTELIALLLTEDEPGPARRVAGDFPPPRASASDFLVTLPTGTDAVTPTSRQQSRIRGELEDQRPTDSEDFRKKTQVHHQGLPQGFKTDTTFGRREGGDSSHVSAVSFAPSEFQH